MKNEDFAQLDIFSLTINSIEIAEIEGIKKDCLLKYYDLKNSTDKSITSCYGDLFIICNALDDYANMLEQAVDIWKLEGYHKACYEIHAARCKKISNKLAEQMGYDKEKVKATCAKKAAQAESTIGEEALTLATTF